MGCGMAPARTVGMPVLASRTHLRRHRRRRSRRGGWRARFHVDPLMGAVGSVNEIPEPLGRMARRTRQMGIGMAPARTVGMPVLASRTHLRRHRRRGRGRRGRRGRRGGRAGLDIDPLVGAVGSVDEISEPLGRMARRTRQMGIGMAPARTVGMPVLASRTHLRRHRRRGRWCRFAPIPCPSSVRLGWPAVVAGMPDRVSLPAVAASGLALRDGISSRLGHQCPVCPSRPEQAVHAEQSRQGTNKPEHPNTEPPPKFAERDDRSSDAPATVVGRTARPHNRQNAAQHRQSHAHAHQPNAAPSSAPHNNWCAASLRFTTARYTPTAMGTTTADRIERFLAANPTGPLVVAVGYASAFGLAWLQDRAAGRAVSILIGDTRPAYWQKMSNAPIRGAPQGVAQLWTSTSLRRRPLRG